MSAPAMEHIDASALDTDLQARVTYLAKFIGVGSEDAKALHDAAPFASARIPAIVDAVCKIYKGKNPVARGLS